MANNNAAMYNSQMLRSAGINPYAVLPRDKVVEEGPKSCLKEEIRKSLRIMDEQNAINRFTWYNLPRGLTGQLIERILYYKGQGMFFRLQDKFFFLPYSLDGTIDVYGRFMSVTPLPFNGTSNDGGKGDKPWIQGLSFNPQYEVAIPEDFMKQDGTPEVEKMEQFLDKACVLLKDYSEQYSQTILPRKSIQEPVLDLMSECYPFMRTALINGSGVRGIKVSDETEAGEVMRANAQITNSALNGTPYTPIKGAIDFQELTNGSPAQAQEFLLAMQSLDSFRLSLYGLDSGGIFQKKAHMLEAEQEMNAGNTGLVLQDSLNLRQNFATICNSIWGTAIWVEPNEVVLGIDRNMDGAIEGDPEATVPGDSAPANNTMEEEEI